MNKHKVHILRIDSNGNVDEREDFVALDVPICIFVNDEPFRTLITSPSMLKELALGHLLTEGALTSMNQVSDVQVKTSRINVVINHKVDLVRLNIGKSSILTTACGLESKIPDSELNRIKVKPSSLPPPNEIHKVVKELNSLGKTFKETGGTHSALLYSKSKGALTFVEDVGRHNAVDKVIGSGLMSTVDFSECALALSGRLSGEIVLKAARAGIPQIYSVSAPLYSGIRVACATGVKLIGFVRGSRMNQYLC
jgi:FdhD protein